MKTLHTLALAIAVLFSTAALAAEETPNAIPGGTFVSVEEAKAQFEKGAKFVDARVAAEYAEKHVKGAVSVPYKETHPKVSKVDAADGFDAAKVPPGPVVFYCNGSPCWKAYKAAAAAIKAGHKQVYWFRDGMPAWDAKSLPVE
jgi:rhodanese-related sulfurtransferase